MVLASGIVGWSLSSFLSRSKTVNTCRISYADADERVVPVKSARSIGTNLTSKCFSTVQTRVGDWRERMRVGRRHHRGDIACFPLRSTVVIVVVVVSSDRKHVDKSAVSSFTITHTHTHTCMFTSYASRRRRRTDMSCYTEQTVNIHIRSSTHTQDRSYSAL